MAAVGNSFGPASSQALIPLTGAMPGTRSAWQSLIETSTLAAIEVACQSLPEDVRRDLRGVAQALRGGNLSVSLRELDRAWRRFPDLSRTLAPVYGRLLSLEGRDPNAALRMLDHSVDPDPDLAALGALALLRMRSCDEASRRIGEALSGFCVLPESLLSAVAREIVGEVHLRGGWAALGPGLELVGECLGIGAQDSL
jgi:hypothetical protein